MYTNTFYNIFFQEVKKTINLCTKIKMFNLTIEYYSIIIHTNNLININTIIIELIRLE